jgi:hypothetical protein
VFIPHATASLVTLEARLADAEYRRRPLLAGAAPLTPFERCDSSLHAAVPRCRGRYRGPPLPPPASELRTYRSPSEPAGRKKIEMFEAGGELAIFRRLGLHTVFFARDLVGAGLPSLTYMLAFADVAAREKAWAAFREDPEWVGLRDQPAYADIVSGIDAALLRPTTSQL